MNVFTDRAQSLLLSSTSKTRCAVNDTSPATSAGIAVSQRRVVFAPRPRSPSGMVFAAVVAPGLIRWSTALRSGKGQSLVRSAVAVTVSPPAGSAGSVVTVRVGPRVSNRVPLLIPMPLTGPSRR